ncbi:Crp/Fnr family transcriptional regulator [Lactobacillus terrae]|uniref:Crp/Fnr family transcriptional regulator n=1 Tax=Lactobacillus terrae TaxID=2269374 RepID=UPI000C1B698B|nr:Crp/Fnr family transcriptional regulator [Lactobacillus terrae]
MEHSCVSLVPLFNNLSDDDQREIHSLVNHRSFKKGELLFQPSDESSLVIIASGKVKIYQLTSGGKEQLLRVSNSGDYEGENLLFGDKNTSRYGEAIQDTKVCTLRYDDFKNLLLSNSNLSWNLLSINADKLVDTEKQNKFLTMDRVAERLASYLIDLSIEFDKDSFKLPMKKKELASFLGTTPETLSRKLKLLVEQSLIDLDNSHVTILDTVKLEDI